MLRPRSEEQVIELIRGVRGSGRKLRVHGAQHSVAPSIATGQPGGLELQLDRLNHVGFETASRVRVGSGCRMHADPLLAGGFGDYEQSLSAALERRGRALCNVGGVMHQTLTGFLSTGSAGGSFRHSLHARVQRLRLIDAAAQVHDLTVEHPWFGLVGVGMGLCGVISEVALETEPHFDVFGSEQVVERARAPFDLLARGRGGVCEFLDQHEYARIFWFPQPGVDRLALWTAARAGPGDYDARTGPPGQFKARPYRALPRVLGSDRPIQSLLALALLGLDRFPNRALARRLIEGFLPEGVQHFWDRWHGALPMDSAIDEQRLPFEFAELWFARADAPEALARLDAFFRRFELQASGNFAVELYAGSDNPFALGPGHGQPSLRINFMHSATNRQSGAARFAPIWDLFEDMAPRLHWGKHLPPPPRAASWIARAWPRLPEFLGIRAELDPDGVFLSSYFRERLGLPETRPRPVAVPNGAPGAVANRGPASANGAPERHAPHVVRWPLAFVLEPVGEDFSEVASRQFAFAARSCADLEPIFDAFTTMEQGGAWMAQFRGVERDAADPEHVFDEHFSFMRLRVRTLRSERPSCWVARIEAASLPLATRMLERLDLERAPDGRCHVRWRMYFDPHPLAEPFERQLRPLFERMFRRSLQRLGTWAETTQGIARS